MSLDYIRLSHLTVFEESEIRFNGGARMKGKPIKEQRLDDLESAFRPLLQGFL